MTCAVLEKMKASSLIWLRTCDVKCDRERYGRPSIEKNCSSESKRKKTETKARHDANLLLAGLVGDAGNGSLDGLLVAEVASRHGCKGLHT